MSRSVRRHNPFGRIAELFDASAIGLVTLLLLGASFYATWQGMSDFVTSKDAGEGAGVAGLVVLVVLTLILAMYVALRETVNPIRLRNIFIAFPLYALLALWSVGFGYGFWWSLVAGQDTTEVARAVEDLWLGLFARVGLVERDVTAGVRLEGRSLIALMATIGVDFALFVFALLRGGLRREYEEGPPPPAVIEHEGPVGGGGEAKSLLPAEPKRPALTGPPADKPVKSRPRVETNPKAVGIGSTDADSHSQIGDAEQVTDLIRSVDGLYRAMTKDEVIADKDEEIARLQEELNTLQRRGYVATGRPGQEFDGFLHKQVGTQPSDEPKGTIIITVKPGFMTEGQNIYRIAEVIVSSGPRDFEF